MIGKVFAYTAVGGMTLGIYTALFSGSPPHNIGPPLKPIPSTTIDQPDLNGTLPTVTVTVTPRQAPYNPPPNYPTFDEPQPNWTGDPEPGIPYVEPTQTPKPTFAHPGEMLV
jgi:hypothetical protein